MTKRINKIGLTAIILAVSLVLAGSTVYSEKLITPNDSARDKTITINTTILDNIDRSFDYIKKNDNNPMDLIGGSEGSNLYGDQAEGTYGYLFSWDDHIINGETEYLVDDAKAVGVEGPASEIFLNMDNPIPIKSFIKGLGIKDYDLEYWEMYDCKVLTFEHEGYIFDILLYDEPGANGKNIVPTHWVCVYNPDRVG